MLQKKKPYVKTEHIFHLASADVYLSDFTHASDAPNSFANLSLSMIHCIVKT